jgi:hypothetical protein
METRDKQTHSAPVIDWTEYAENRSLAERQQHGCLLKKRWRGKERDIDP